MPPLFFSPIRTAAATLFEISNVLEKVFLIFEILVIATPLGPALLLLPSVAIAILRLSIAVLRLTIAISVTIPIVSPVLLLLRSMPLRRMAATLNCRREQFNHESLKALLLLPRQYIQSAKQRLRDRNFEFGRIYLSVERIGYHLVAIAKRGDVALDFAFEVSVSLLFRARLRAELGKLGNGRDKLVQISVKVDLGEIKIARLVRDSGPFRRPISAVSISAVKRTIILSSPSASMVISLITNIVIVVLINVPIVVIPIAIVKIFTSLGTHGTHIV